MAEFFSTQLVTIPVFYSDTWNEYVGGFQVDRFLACQPSATSRYPFPDVGYQTDPGSNPCSSRPATSPWVGLKINQAMKACANRSIYAGPGWHLLTAYEWSIILEYMKKYSWMPNGNDSNNTVAASADDSAERGIQDYYAIEQDWDAYRALPGTGPSTWTHNNDASSGVYDLNGITHKMLMGCFVKKDFTAYQLLANRYVDLARSPYGRATSVDTDSLTDSNKSWTENEFAGCYLYYETDTWYTVTSNTSNTLTLSDTPSAVGAYVIVREISGDIRPTDSGYYIQSLYTPSDGEVGYYNLPKTAGSSPNSTYGGDYWTSYTTGGDPDWVNLQRGFWYARDTRSGVYATRYGSEAWTSSPLCAFFCARAL